MEKTFYKNIFLNRFIYHIRTVQDNMIMLENNLSKLPFKINDFKLLKRSMSHDLDKIQSDLIDTYLNISKYHYNKNNNIENNIDISSYVKNTEKHYRTQRHHFYKNGIKANYVDICEMCCDTDAVSIERHEETNSYYFEKIMLIEYKNLQRYKEQILLIFNLLKKLHKNIEYDNINKFNFINTKLKYIREFQNKMLILEKNKNLLPFKIDDFEIIKSAFSINEMKLFNKLNNVCIFSNSNKTKINNLDICKYCCDFCINNCKNTKQSINKNYLNYKNEINNILEILKTK